MARESGVVARGRVDAGTTPVWYNRDGFLATIARASAGQYTLTLQGGGVDPDKGSYFATLEQDGNISARPLSDTQISITINNGSGAAADLDFSIKVERVSA